VTRTAGRSLNLAILVVPVRADCLATTLKVTDVHTLPHRLLMWHGSRLRELKDLLTVSGGSVRAGKHSAEPVARS
jgi:hypothetical protein